MVGLSASGKSTIAEEISKNKNAKIISSDDVRKEICGDIQDQTKNDKVFEIFHRRIKDYLLLGNNVVADATNLSVKSRKIYFKNLSNVKCEIIAYITPKKFEDCIKDNNLRERKVPDYVIGKQRNNFQIPLIEEGFSKIIIHNYGYEKDIKFLNDTLSLMRGFDQCNTHHTMTLDKHCDFTANKMSQLGYNFDFYLAARLHDVGKLFTQTFDEYGCSHYYGHDNAGAYYLLSNINSFNLPKEIINTILFIVNYHMIPFFAKSEKSKRKWIESIGEDKFNTLLDFNKCDKER